MNVAVQHIGIELPELHPGQIAAWRMQKRNRFLAVRCGRRWGKTKFAVTIACDCALKKEGIGYFAPDYKRILEPRNDIFQMLAPVKAASSKTEGQIKTISGGFVDFWTLNDILAGRGREYHGVIVDEAAFADENRSTPEMLNIWQKAIRPTLLRYRGWCLVLSNTNGVDETQFFYKIIEEKGDDGEPRWGFREYHAPSHDNPYIPRDELVEIERTEMPEVYRQEYLAEFVDWSGLAFFMLDKLLRNGEAVPYPPHCDFVFATIDTSVKTGKENDGTAVIYWAFNEHEGTGDPLTVLDWDLIQIEGSLLEVWLKGVFERLEQLARECRARGGSRGAWIEDKASGMVLIQQAQRRDWPAHEIDTKLTALGKDERAISVSGYHYQGKVKLSSVAHDKVTIYKGTSRNHLRGQVIGYRIGDKDRARQDDLLDCYTYGLSIGLGNQEGF